MEKISLKRYEINELVGAIKGLDGRPELVKDGDGKSLGVIVKPFELESKARYALAKTLRTLSGELTDYETVQKAIMAEKPPVSEKPLEGWSDDESKNRIRIFMLESVEVEVHKVKIQDLKVDTNKLAPQVIANLMPMLEGEL